MQKRHTDFHCVKVHFDTISRNFYLFERKNPGDTDFQFQRKQNKSDIIIYLPNMGMNIRGSDIFLTWKYSRQ